MIDFKILLINGYVNEYDYFIKYLIREQKKAEAEHYDAEEFFNKCLDVIESFKEEINTQYYKRKREIYLMQSLPNFSDESFKNAMEDNTPYNYSIILYHATNYKFSGHLFLMHVIDIEEKIKEAQGSVLLVNQNEAKQPLKLENFFNKDVTPKLIDSIQNSFKELRGREMAILIYLMDKEFHLITLDNSNRNAKSRLHFVRAFTNSDVKNIKGINNYFEAVSGETTVNKLQDPIYLQIKKDLETMVSNG